MFNGRNASWNAIGGVALARLGTVFVAFLQVLSLFEIFPPQLRIKVEGSH